MNSEEIHSGLIWITGFSAAGKTTVARKANQLFKEVIPSVKFTNLEEGLKKLTSQIRKSNEKK